MLSPALAHLLDRARSRFGLEVEVLDAGLRSVYPESATELTRMLRSSSEVRQTLEQALQTGRPQELDQEGFRYRFYPLRQLARRRPTGGLLAVRRDIVCDAEPWSELARAIVEADLASGDVLLDERERSRRLVGVLRFLEYLGAAADEESVTTTLVQAIAIWYDVEARVYRRSLDDAFVLHAWLPGAPPEPAAARLSPSVFDGADFRRLASPSEVGYGGPAHDVCVLAMGSDADRAARGLVLIGAIPSDAEFVIRAAAGTAARQLAAIDLRLADEARLELEAIAARPAPAPELVALRLVQRLVHLTGGASGSLTLQTRNEWRRIAAVGANAQALPAQPPSTRLAPDALAQDLSFESDSRALLHITPAEGGQFSARDVRILRACAPVIRTWLAGTLTAFRQAGDWLEAEDENPAFAARIQEELARAKRFGLDLSLILIEIAAPSTAVAGVQDAVRRELRGSDVLGVMGSRQVAALLTHTSGAGLDNVVQRLRDRLAASASQLQVHELKLGRAAFAPDCGTADELLMRAALSAEPVIVH
jgi:hypothetical protein